jgi:tetratricopeptide (TPR) repeat protein
MDPYEIDRATKQAQALKRSGRADEAIHMLESLLNTCQHDDTVPGGMAMIHKSVAKAYYSKRDFEHAGQHYLKAIRLYGEQGVDEQVAVCIYHFGCCTETFVKSPHFKYYFNGVSHGNAAPFPAEVEMWIFEMAQEEYRKYLRTGCTSFPQHSVEQHSVLYGFLDRMRKVFNN